MSVRSISVAAVLLFEVAAPTPRRGNATGHRGAGRSLPSCRVMMADGHRCLDPDPIRISRKTIPAFPLSRHGPAGSGKTAGHADRAAL